MVLNFGSTGEYGKAVFGDTSSQHAGQNGAIAMNNPAGMQGGKRKNRRNSNKKNKNKKGGNKSQRQNKKQRQNKSKRQRGGK